MQRKVEQGQDGVIDGVFIVLHGLSSLPAARRARRLPAERRARGGEPDAAAGYEAPSNARATSFGLL
jgi:hypothetical protein